MKGDGERITKSTASGTTTTGLDRTDEGSGTPTTNSIMLTLNFSGRRSLSAQKKECAACGYPSAKTRKCT